MSDFPSTADRIRETELPFGPFRKRGIVKIAHLIDRAVIQVIADAVDAWFPIDSAPRHDEAEKNAALLVLSDGRRFVATYDGDSGQWFGLLALDGIERERYFQEWPGRLYSVTHWRPFPATPAIKKDRR